MANISLLPAELVFLISDMLACPRDLSSWSRCSRAMHWLLSDILFDEAFARQAQRAIDPNRVFKKIFIHAVKHDSRNLVVWLASREFRCALTGVIGRIGHPVASFSSRFSNLVPFEVSYLHYAVLNDAPNVATELVKQGAYVHDLHVHPDLEPLCLDLSLYRSSTTGLNGPLHIACSYALPRTIQYLLRRGADPNCLSRFGLAPFHTAVRSRLPWRNFEWISNNREDDHWERSVTRAVSTLLQFGGDPNLKTDTSRIHVCGHGCWRSPDCGHRGQTCLHLACASGIKPVVALLLERGADSELHDEAGHLPLYYAMSQGHVGVAFLLICRSERPDSLILVEPSQSTALHIAARFGLHSIVEALLRPDVGPNTCDSSGRTPMDEAMARKAPELEKNLEQVIYMLRRHMLRHRKSKYTHASPSPKPTKRAIESYHGPKNGIIEDIKTSIPAAEGVNDVSVAHLPRPSDQRRTKIESFPPLNADSVVTHKDVLRPSDSWWFDENKRKNLADTMSDSSPYNSREQGPLISQASLRQYARVDQTYVACKIESSSLPESPSAKFWKALSSQGSNNTGNAATNEPTEQHSTTTTKKKSRKWVHLQL